MTIERWQLKRDATNRKFKVITAVQSTSYYRLYSNLWSALLGYAKEYLKMHKLYTANISLKEWLITDEVGETE